MTGSVLLNKDDDSYRAVPPLPPCILVSYGVRSYSMFFAPLKYCLYSVRMELTSTRIHLCMVFSSMLMAKFNFLSLKQRDQGLVTGFYIWDLRFLSQMKESKRLNPFFSFFLDALIFWSLGNIPNCPLLVSSNQEHVTCYLWARIRVVCPFYRFLLITDLRVREFISHDPLAFIYVYQKE